MDKDNRASSSKTHDVHVDEDTGCGKAKPDDDTVSWISVDSSDDSDSETLARKLLDPKSSLFNAKLALYSKRQSVSNSYKYRNILHFRKSIPKFNQPPIFPIRSPKKKSKTPSPNKPTKDGASTSTSESVQAQPYYPIPGRRFLAHQLPVYRPRKQRPNVITLMDSMSGPIEGLNSARLNKTKVKVWTRSLSGIRGFCIGLVEAFDKHWNLTLSDCYEVFQRKRNIKFPYQSTRENKSEMQFENQSASRITRSKHRQSTTSSTYRNFSSESKKGIKSSVLLDGENFLEICRKGLENLKIESTRNKPKVSKSTKLLGSHLGANLNKLSNSQLRKKRLVFLQNPERDFHNNLVLARSKNYELVERYLPNLFLLGNEIAFVETK